MHFSINRDYFINQLNHVARAIPGKAAIPVLTGMKLELAKRQPNFKLPHQVVLSYQLVSSLILYVSYQLIK